MVPNRLQNQGTHKSNGFMVILNMFLRFKRSTILGCTSFTNIPEWMQMRWSNLRLLYQGPGLILRYPPARMPSWGWESMLFFRVFFSWLMNSHGSKNIKNMVVFPWLMIFYGIFWWSIDLFPMFVDFRSPCLTIKTHHPKTLLGILNCLELEAYKPWRNSPHLWSQRSWWISPN